MNQCDEQYLSLVKDVLENGDFVETRAKINGENVGAYSVIGRQARFDLTNGFPILTTKKVHFDSVAHELIWFLRGDSNIKYLKDNNIRIWDKWANENGELGFGTYGTLWRGFPFHVFDSEFELHYPDMLNDYCLNSYDNLDRWKDPEERHKWHPITHICYENDVDGSVDQIKQLLINIEKVKKDPTASEGRRLIVSAWHPYYVDKVGLPPCHVLFQFTVRGNNLSCHLYQRSCDLFLGIPFNITSYALLTCLVAHLTGLVPKEFIHTYHDLHIYENHIDQIKEQLKRPHHPTPTLRFEGDFNVDTIQRSNIILEGYKHSGVLRGEVAV